MLIDDFVRSAIKQDKRNVFEKTKLYEIKALN